MWDRALKNTIEKKNWNDLRWFIQLSEAKRFGMLRWLRWCRNGCYNQCPTIMIHHHVMIRSAFGGFRRRRLLWPGASTAAIKNAGKNPQTNSNPIPQATELLSYVIICYHCIYSIHCYSTFFVIFLLFFLRKASFSRRGTLLGDRQRWAGLSGTWSVMNHKYGLMVYTTTYIYVCIHIPPIKMNHLVVLPSSSIFNLQSHSKQPSKMIGMNSPILSRLYFIRTNTANRTASLAHFNPAGLSRWLEDSLSESFLSQWHVSDIEAMTKSGRLMPEGVEMFQMELDDW